MFGVAQDIVSFFSLSVCVMYVHTRVSSTSTVHFCFLLLQESFIQFANRALSGKREEEDTTRSLGGKLLTAAAFVGVAAIAGFFAVRGT